MTPGSGVSVGVTVGSTSARAVYPSPGASGADLPMQQSGMAGRSDGAAGGSLRRTGGWG